MGSNYDPDYIYLLNSLNILLDKGIGHYDHPGTTLQVLGSWIIKTSHLIRTGTLANLQVDVLANPEFYLEAISKAVILINALLIFVIGATAHRLTKSYWQSSLLQLSPFFAATILNNSLTKVSPEILLLTAILILIILILRTLGSTDHPKQHAIAFATVIGFGIATKITFAPIALIPLFVLSKWKNRAFYLVMIPVAFVLFTLPIISAYRKFINWIFALFSHTGRYGTGKEAIIDPVVYFRNIVGAIQWVPAFSIILALAIIGVFASLFAIKEKTNVYKTERRLLIGTILAQLFGILMVAKQPGTHYMIPLFLLSGLELFLLFRLIQYNSPSSKARIFSHLVVVIATVYALGITSFDVVRVHKMLSQEKNELYAIHAKLENDFHDYGKIYYFRSSTPVNALKFGDALSLEANSNSLKNMYNDFYYYEIGQYKFFNWDKEVGLDELRAKYNNKLLLIGTPFNKGYKNEPRYIPSFPITDIMDGANETIYKIESGTLNTETKANN